jgi:hypothetical protein
VMAAVLTVVLTLLTIALMDLPFSGVHQVRFEDLCIVPEELITKRRLKATKVRGGGASVDRITESAESAESWLNNRASDGGDIMQSPGRQGRGPLGFFRNTRRSSNDEVAAPAASGAKKQKALKMSKEGLSIDVASSTVGAADDVFCESRI